MKKYSEDLLKVVEENGYDSVEEYIESSKENDLNYIATLIEQGYTSGYYPTWCIYIEEDEEDKKLQREHIANLIREGHESGDCPKWSDNVVKWSVNVVKWSYEDYL